MNAVMNVHMRVMSACTAETNRVVVKRVEQLVGAVQRTSHAQTLLCTKIPYRVAADIDAQIYDFQCVTVHMSWSRQSWKASWSNGLHPMPHRPRHLGLLPPNLIHKNQSIAATVRTVLLAVLQHDAFGHRGDAIFNRFFLLCCTCGDVKHGGN